ncbi:preprotein translocase subunit SecY [Chitinispirillales bacterium ANBcel5]|uniref:preprotein translocase subunit SecY n=1 Tax=Cellulosispirillum alkaliphilum TaxID=3039283 RepID=UPI002A4E44CC|nr:preprotein translocase subunit SecY [Chitinispirillales bacterium ANBcel5]
MLDTVKNIFRIPELRKRIIFTLVVIFIYRIGGHVPTPGVNPQVLAEFFGRTQNSLFGLYDMFVGGAFKRLTVFALGIMPYISASIIIQLLGTVFPYFHKLQREGAEGRKKITQYTRYGTVILALIQAIGISVFIQNITSETGESAVVPFMQGFLFMFTTAISLTTGTILIMWLGEQITNRGVGNGISLIIFIGIVAGLPAAVYGEFQQIFVGTRHPIISLVLLAIILAMTAFVVMMTQAMRRIPIQTPKKVVGTKMYAGQNTVLPLRLNMAGVIPVIFASSLMTFPGMIGSFFPESGVMEDISRLFAPGGILYSIIYGLLIIFFTYFYTAIIFNPVDIADNLKRSGGFIPGIRPGKKTAEFLDNVLTRITLPGSVFLAFIAIAPFLVMGAMRIDFYFGGTSVLIVVGVALDTLQQLESHLQSRNYEGFMKKGRLRGRRY